MHTKGMQLHEVARTDYIAHVPSWSVFGKMLPCYHLFQFTDSTYG